MERPAGNLRRLGFCLFLFFMSAGGCWAAATYSERTGEMKIPLADVPGLGAFTVRMTASNPAALEFGEELEFVLARIEAAEISNEIPSSISLETLVLHIPLLWVSDVSGSPRLFSVDLGAVPETDPLRFRTTNIQPLSSQGVIGTPGPQGPQGDTGPAGPRGANGNPGPAGPQGPTGSQGIAGPAGAQGDTGGIGPQGIRGLTWTGTWDNAATYQTDDAVSYNGSSYICLTDANTGNQPDTSPTSWELLSQRGDTGPQGMEGPQGLQGAVGAQGSIGPPGLQGTQGIPGPAGPRGDRGDIGPQGLQGAVGAQGSVGPPGPQGTQGTAGPAGPQGIRGLTWTGAWDNAVDYQVDDAASYNGSSYISLTDANTGNQPDASPTHWELLSQKGDTGPEGMEGPQGAVGAQGPAGTAGPAGPQGLQGLPGSSLSFYVKTSTQNSDSITVSCDTGGMATGGGFKSLNASIYDSFPVLSGIIPVGWTALFSEVDPSNTVYVICAVTTP